MRTCLLLACRASSAPCCACSCARRDARSALSASSCCIRAATPPHSTGGAGGGAAASVAIAAQREASLAVGLQACGRGHSREVPSAAGLRRPLQPDRAGPMSCQATAEAWRRGCRRAAALAVRQPRLPHAASVCNGWDRCVLPSVLACLAGRMWAAWRGCAARSCGHSGRRKHRCWASAPAGASSGRALAQSELARRCSTAQGAAARATW